MEEKKEDNANPSHENYSSPPNQVIMERNTKTLDTIDGVSEDDTENPSHENLIDEENNSNESQKVDSPVEGSDGDNQADIGLGGSSLVAEQSTENVGVHAEESTNDNIVLNEDNHSNESQTVDSPVEGTDGENQADIGPGGSSSVTDQSTENDQPTQALIVDSQMLFGIPSLKRVIWVLHS